MTRKIFKQSCGFIRFYGFSKNSDGQLLITTTNQGADSINAASYAGFDDVLFSASGFTFSINANGNLISTI